MWRCHGVRVPVLLLLLGHIGLSVDASSLAGQRVTGANAA
jgi:hypothetical protein